MKNVRDGFHLLELERKIWMHGLAFKQSGSITTRRDTMMPGTYRWK
jgi:hypothetical protein